MAQAGKLLKESMARELREELSRRQHFVVASLGALHATEAATLRKQLSAVKARLLMVKRTIGARVLGSLDGSGGPAADVHRTAELLTGSVALILAEQDAGPAANILAQFLKSHEGTLSIRGGWVEGRLLDAAGMRELADLPSKPQLIAQLIGTLEAPVTDLIMTIETVCRELVWVLDEASKKKQEGS